MDFAASPEYPLLKQAILSQVALLFDETTVGLREAFPLLSNHHTKITRGENHHGMPYVVLDFPQIASADFDLLTRTLFWWGHYFSYNLIVRKDRLGPQTITFSEKVYVQVSGDLWNNNLDQHYLFTDTLNPEDIKGAYIRISQPLPLHAYAQIMGAGAVYKRWAEELNLH